MKKKTAHVHIAKKSDEMIVFCLLYTAVCRECYKFDCFIFHRIAKSWLTLVHIYVFIQIIDERQKKYGEEYFSNFC